MENYMVFPPHTLYYSDVGMENSISTGKNTLKNAIAG